MKVVTKNGKVIATHSDEQEVEGLYPGADVFCYEGKVQPGDDDPRASLSTVDALKVLRIKRDLLLRESDWTQLPDVPLSAEVKKGWETYRQALRDLPQSLGEKKLHEVTWPQKPK
jgi:hypothetical protein